MDTEPEPLLVPRSQWPDYEQEWYNMPRADACGMHWSNIPTSPRHLAEYRDKAFHTEDAVLEQLQRVDWLTTWLAAKDVALFDHCNKRVLLATRVACVDHTGRTLAFSSYSAVREIRQIVEWYGKQAWIPPLMLEFRRSHCPVRGEVWTIKANPWKQGA